mmetsp:Transcript_14309/g.34615  ORF Transcript_14309/g.34615 Transcript_14309/m.34615 type:complete len:206 (-) Transcript_14309:756-1373(-)
MATSKVQGPGEPLLLLRANPSSELWPSWIRTRRAQPRRAPGCCPPNILGQGVSRSFSTRRVENFAGEELGAVAAGRGPALVVVAGRLPDGSLAACASASSIEDIIHEETARLLATRHHLFVRHGVGWQSLTSPSARGAGARAESVFERAASCVVVVTRSSLVSRMRRTTASAFLESNPGPGNSPPNLIASDGLPVAVPARQSAIN